MNNANGIIEQLRHCKSDNEVKPLIEAFRQLPVSEKQAVESQLIQLLEDETENKVPRSWVPTLLGAVGTETARQYLITRLPEEKEDLFRRWICIVLIRYFTSDDRIEKIVQQIDREETASNRLSMINALVEARSPAAIDKFIEFLEEESNEHAIRFRLIAAKGLGQIRHPKTVEPLLKQLAVEREMEVKQEIIEALVAIHDPRAVPGLLNILEDQTLPTRLHVTALQAIGQLGTTEIEDLIPSVLKVTCYADRVVAFTATDTLLKLVSQDEAARLLIEFGLQQTIPDALSRVADALRVVGGLTAINILQSVKGDPIQEQRAQILLEEIGGRQALNVLVDRRVDVLNQAGSRVKDFDGQALTIFESTIEEAKRGFTISLWMSGTIFFIGVILLGISIYLMLRPDPTMSQQIFGIGGGLAGLGSILAMFYKGPMERIELAVANLVQTEIAFLGYIRQVTQITAMFEREYLDNEGFNLVQLKELLAYTERSMKETMPLVSRYTAVSLDKIEQEDVGKE